MQNGADALSRQSISPNYDGPIVGVLGEITVAGIAFQLSGQQLSLVSFLASVGSSTRRGIADALWDGSRVSEGRLANLLSETRRALGEAHLPVVDNGRYQLVDLPTDLDLFQILVRSSTGGTSADEVELLTEALSLVRGVPYTAPGLRYWGWPSMTPGLSASAEILVSDTALNLAELALGSGDLQSARWACEQGLRAVPLDQELTSTLSQVFLAMGKPMLAARLLADNESAVASLGLASPALKSSVLLR